MTLDPPIAPREIRPLEATHYDEVVRLLLVAFASYFDADPAGRERFRAHTRARLGQSATAAYHGCFDGERLVAVLRLHDFRMNFAGTELPILGLGGVGVDLAYRKQGLCRRMVEYFLAEAQRRRVGLVALYPFRPDFYQRMGFGFGAPRAAYALDPAALPRRAQRLRLVQLRPADAPRLLDCYERQVRAQHGMLSRDEDDVRRIFFEDEALQVYACEDGARLSGYLAFRLVGASQTNALTTDLEVQEWGYEDARALSAILDFLACQVDQVRRIRITTQDERFFHLFGDPRDGSDREFHHAHQSHVNGVGLMYRVTDPALLFDEGQGGLRGHRFGPGRVRASFAVDETMPAPLCRRFTLEFADGTARLLPAGPGAVEADLRVRLGVAHFSSWLVGAVSLARLAHYGLAEVPAADAHLLDQALGQGGPPVCQTMF